MANVIVWYPDMSELNVGHASLLLDRLARPVYISYWPESSVGIKESSSKTFITPTYAEDVRAENANPTYIISINCLDEDAISHWWNKLDKRQSLIPYSPNLIPNSENYDLYRNNCSTIVALAMKVGGADRVVPFPEFNLLTPIHIHTWASLIKIREN